MARRGKHLDHGELEARSVQGLPEGEEKRPLVVETQRRDFARRDVALCERRAELAGENARILGRSL